MYQRTYQELFNNLYHKTAGLKILASMKPYWNNPIIQQVINGQKTIRIIKCSQFPTSFAHEFGTGNVDMTTGDLYWYLHQLMSGHLVSTALQKYGRLLSKVLIMAASMFMIIIYAYGVEAGQQALVLFSKDMKTGVILLTNCVNPAKYKN